MNFTQKRKMKKKSLIMLKLFLSITSFRDVSCVDPLTLCEDVSMESGDVDVEVKCRNKNNRKVTLIDRNNILYSLSFNIIYCLSFNIPYSIS